MALESLQDCINLDSCYEQYYDLFDKDYHIDPQVAKGQRYDMFGCLFTMPAPMRLSRMMEQIDYVKDRFDLKNNDDYHTAACLALATYRASLEIANSKREDLYNICGVIGAELTRKELVSKEEILHHGGIEGKAEFFLDAITSPMSLDEFEFYKEILRIYMRLEGLNKEALSGFHEAIHKKLFSYGDEIIGMEEIDLSEIFDSLASNGNPDEIDLTNPMEVRGYLGKSVIGQDQTISRVSIDVATLYRYKLRNMDFKTMVRLLIADAGQGKSIIFRTLSRVMPVKIVNLAAFSETSFKGKTIERDLLEDVKPYSILVLDEADKKIRPSFDSHSKNINFAVLSELNMALSGDDDRCRSCIFYLLGAFSEIRERKRHDALARSIGFVTKDEIEKGSYDVITRKDLIDYGMPRELGSRATIIQMNKLTRDDFYNILKNAEGSPMELMRQKVAVFDIDLKFEETFLDQLVDEAYQSDTGARGLTAAMDLMVTDKLYQAIESGENSIVLTGNDKVDMCC